MATKARLTDDLKLVGEVDERLPSVTDGLTHHFPMDGPGGTFDIVGGSQSDQNTSSGVNLLESMDLNWQDPSSWAGNAPTWDDTHEAIKWTGYSNNWLKTPIIIDPTKEYQLSIDVMEEVQSAVGLYIGGYALNAAGQKVTTNYDYTMASNDQPSTGIWKTYKLTRTGTAVAWSGTSTSFSTVKGWSGTAAISDVLTYFYHFGGLFNYSSGGVMYIKNLSIVAIDPDTSNTTITSEGLAVEELTTNLVPTSSARTFSAGNTHGTYNVNQYNSNNDFSIGTVSGVSGNVVTLSSVDHAINTYDVLNPATTGGGVTAGTHYFIKKLSSTTFTLHAYTSVQDGSTGFAVHDSINNDVRVSINATSFPTMWHGAPHKPNSGLVKEIIPNGYSDGTNIYDCMRLHTEHRKENGGSTDRMAYGVYPQVTSGLEYTFSYRVRAASSSSVGATLGMSMHTGASWPNSTNIVLTEEWQTLKLTSTAPNSGNTNMYFSQTTYSTVDIALLQCEQKTFATSFVDGSRAEGDFKLTNVLNPNKGTVIIDVTFHEDNAINGLQAADQYCFSNQGAWNAANSFIFHDTDYWWIYDSNTVKHSMYMNTPIVREERVQVALVYNDTDGTMDIYRNGILDSSGTKQTAMIGLLSSIGTDWTHSGHAATTDYKMCQTIHNLSFYDTPLSAAQMKTLGKNALSIQLNGDVRNIVKEAPVGWTKVYDGVGTHMCRDAWGGDFEDYNVYGMQFNQMLVRPKYFTGYDVIATTTETAKLTNSIKWYIEQLYATSDTGAPQIKFHGLDNVLDVQFTVPSVLFSGYGNSWRRYIPQIYVQDGGTEGGAYNYYGAIPGAIVKADWLAEFGGTADYPSAAASDNNVVRESGIFNLTPREWQTIEIYVKETATPTPKLRCTTEQININNQIIEGVVL